MLYFYGTYQGKKKKKNLKTGEKHLFFNEKRKRIEQTSIAL